MDSQPKPVKPKSEKKPSERRTSTPKPEPEPPKLEDLREELRLYLDGIKLLKCLSKQLKGEGLDANESAFMRQVESTAEDCKQRLPELVASAYESFVEGEDF